MKNLFCTHNQSLALKELGFDEPCFAFYAIPNVGNKLFFDIDPDDGELTSLNQNQIYHNNLSEVGRISAPLKSQVFEWFRKEHHMFSHIMTYEGNEIPRFKGEFAYFAEIDFLIASEEIEKPFKTYEEAESACIDRLIEIVKNR